MPRRILRAWLLLSFWLSGCSLVDPVVCTTSVEPALIVEVRDAESGEPAALGAVAEVTDGEYKEELVLHSVYDADLLIFAGPPERAGNYHLTVIKSGYYTWERPGINVTRDECHVRTVQVRVDLRPL